MTTRPAAAFCLALALLSTGFPAAVSAQSGVANQAPTPAQQAFDRALAELQKGNRQAALDLLEPFKRDPKAGGPLLSLLAVAYLESNRAKDAWALLEPLTRAEDADPAVLYQAARAAATLGQAKQAEALLERSVAASPVSPAARELGIARSRQHRAVEALNLLGPWIDAQPEDQEARLAAVQSAIQLGEEDLAAQLLAGLDDKQPVTQVLKAQVALEKGDTATALATLKPLLATQLGPLEGEVRGLTAEAYFSSNQGAEAVQVLTGKVGQDPGMALLLARALRQQGRLGEAASTLKPFAEQVLAAKAGGAVFPLAGALALEYGRVLVDSGRSREGSEALKKAVALNPQSLAGWQSLAEAAQAIGDGKTATEAKQRADQLAEATRRALGGAAETGNPNLAVMGPVMDALLAGEPEKALTLSRAEAARVPADPRPQLLEVRILLSLDRTEEAARAAETIAAKYPDLPDAIYQRGVMRARSGDAPGAEKDLRRTLELSPNHPAALNDLAVLLMTQKRFAEARPLLEKALAINPQDTLAQQNLKALPGG